MREIHSGRIEGDFEGWDDDAVYELDNGTQWELAQYKYKYTYKYCPRARLLKDGGRFYLEVEGMGDPVQVVPA